MSERRLTTLSIVRCPQSVVRNCTNTSNYSWFYRCPLPSINILACLQIFHGTTRFVIFTRYHTVHNSLSTAVQLHQLPVVLPVLPALHVLRPVLRCYSSTFSLAEVDNIWNES